MAKSYEARNHQEWLGYVQPVGLVVSAPAMLAAECQINRNMGPIHQRFMSTLPLDESEEPIPEIPDFATFTQNVLDWRESDLVRFPVDDVPKHLQSLEIVLDTYNETLRPTFIVPKTKPAENESPWVMLIQELGSEIELDLIPETSGRHWHASPHLKFERLLRESEVPFGLLTNGKSIRIVYAPKGETSGYITFNVDQMATVAGRPIFAALHMLLEAERVFGMEKSKRLPAILANSRKYQNIVSTELAEQVMGALFELLRGFQAADDQRDGQLLKEILANDPQHIYHGLLNVLMRLVFVLYAEDRGLISTDEVYTNHYSVSGLFDRLRSDHGRFPDTMDQRYGAWAQLLTLFRLIHEGGSHGDLTIPARDGYLFDSNRYPFLEGRYDNYDVEVYSDLEKTSQVQVPRVSDGVVYQVLNSLLILQGERLSYRTLDVEQIGSVYEAIMGFELEVSQGRSIAIKPVKKHGAPSTINLEALLEAKPADRSKLVKEWSDQKITGAALKELKAAETIEGIMSALDKKIAKTVTEHIVPKGAMVFQPSDERRRSGSHYTPRSLTEPIVKTTLEPILKQLTCVPGSIKEPSETQNTEPVGSGLMAAEEPAIYKLSESATVAPQPISKELRKRLTPGQVEAREKLEQKRAEAHTAAIRVGSPHPSQILDLKICDPAMGSGAFLVEACRQLGDELIKAWYAHDAVPTDIPPDEDEVLYARRLIAQRCLYGVDKNVMAVDLAKLSLWLVTLAKDHAFTFLDHALRHGDSLVGLTREQIIGFHWEVKKQKKFGEDLIQRRLDRATEARAKILNAREDVPYRDQQQRMAVADEQLDLIRLVGDACVSGFFAGQKKKEREEHAERLFGVASSYLESLTAGRGKQVDFESRRVLGQAAARLRAGSHPIPAFHWEIEFPEVFARENGGFDAFVGNPPFLGGRRIRAALGDSFFDWLDEVHEESSGNADLVAHFFRRAYNLLRNAGTFGLISTNTIGQGDTRSTGLRWICNSGGEVYNARRRVRWPGQAAVVVSVVHLQKRNFQGIRYLDGREVPKITAYLFSNGGNDDPLQLEQNDGKSFVGYYVLGMGFTFDDTDKKNVASSIESMEQVIVRGDANRERIFPFIGGKEVNDSPTHEHHRYVMSFADFPLRREELPESWSDATDAEKKDYLRTGIVPNDYPSPVVADWPDLLEILEEKVKPERTRRKANGDFALRSPLFLRWWQYADKRPALTQALEQVERTLVIAQTSDSLAFAFMPTDRIFAHTLVVFPFDSYSAFAQLQSRPHLVWAEAFAATMKDDSRYLPSDCFMTFPFSEDFLGNQMLQSVGREYYEFRAKLLVNNNEGLTKTYNRFHDPHEQSEGILELRRLHGLMDGAVLRAYGWDDLAESARCEFLLDYEEEEDDADAGPPAAGGRKKSKKKKPWRLRWPDEFRDEVLARLLELNEQRHKEEQMMGNGSKTSGTKMPRSAENKEQASRDHSQTELF